VRTRTTLLQAHTHQFLGTFGGAGNGDYREELKRAIQVITKYATTHKLLPSQILVRLDGLYGNTAVLRDTLDTGLGLIGRSRDYALLDLASVQVVLARPLPPRPMSGTLADSLSWMNTITAFFFQEEILRSALCVSSRTKAMTGSTGDVTCCSSAPGTVSFLSL